jgi:hypothetical protein
MIFPFQYDNDARCFIPRGLECASCRKEISQDEKSVHFSWSETESLYLHVRCAEHVALMMMRDVAECRCGPEIANARYRIVREIVPHPEA